MTIQNIEIKAHCPNPDKIRAILQNKEADYKGTDHQIDTYFKVPEGRMKLREGTIENNLIYYRRADTKTAKKSAIDLVPLDESESLKKLLTNALEVLAVVDKKREIYFIKNVKFHIDEVKKLGSFMEIEAIDEDGSIGEKELRKQCKKYLELFEIEDDDLIACSYSDLLDDEA